MTKKNKSKSRSDKQKAQAKTEGYKKRIAELEAKLDVWQDYEKQSTAEIERLKKVEAEAYDLRKSLALWRRSALRYQKIAEALSIALLSMRQPFVTAEYDALQAIDAKKREAW